MESTPCVHRGPALARTSFWGLIVLASGLSLDAAERSPGAAVTNSNTAWRRIELRVPADGRPGFTELGPAETSVRFTNRITAAALLQNQIFEVGSGVALGDIDGDGRIDLYFCASEGGNRLYRNLGNWQFADITGPAGVACDGQRSTGAALADLDGDGDLDLLVNGIGAGTRLFLNQGAGRFDEALKSGLERGHGSTSFALADVNGDGTLDVYVANYHTRTVKDRMAELDVSAGYVNGKFVVTRPDLFLPIFHRGGGVELFERGEPDVFYLNDGRGRFTPVPWTGGAFLDRAGIPLTEAPREWALAAAFRDLNGDGAPDLYVCNDFFGSPDQYWFNDGTGKFRAAPTSVLRQISMSSMSVDVADLNRDGHDDLLVADMMSRDHLRRHVQRGSMSHILAAKPVEDPSYLPEFPRNTLFLNRGDGTFAEIAQLAGLEASEWTWSVVFLDVDLDGFEDLLVTTGNLRDANDADRAAARAGAADQRGPRPPLPPLEAANLAFRNQGDLTFRERGTEWGFNTFGVSHGMAVADLDNDGDLDLVVNHANRPAGLYRNNSTAPRVAVRLAGRGGKQAIGSRVTLVGGAVNRQSQEIISGGRYLSCDDSMRVFAAGTGTNRMRIEVRWRSGATSTVAGVAANGRYEISEPISSASAPSTSAPATRPVFQDVSPLLTRLHREDPFDDFERQPLLGRKLSSLGPGASWADIDGDGWDDLLIGGSKGHHQVFYINNQRGAFKPQRRKDPPTRDQTTTLVWSRTNGAPSLLVGESNYEDGTTNGGMLLSWEPAADTAAQIAGASDWSLGTVSLGVIGQRLALFAGGRVRPGRYPEAVDSALFVHEGNGWVRDPAAGARLVGGGLVAAAIWTDLDGDGSLELVLAREWGSLRVFTTLGGTLRDATAALGLDSYAGWWNGVASGDFDNDGRLDLLATNLGRNSKYERHRAHPLRIYYGDWEQTDRVQILEAYWESGVKGYVPFLPLDAFRRACPGRAERIASFAAYGTMTVETLVGADSRFLEANTFETTLFLNRGGRFEARPLPIEAQFAPAFGVATADFDGDGNLDAFLSQNFFGVDPETSRYDGGGGLLLRGDGTGRLTPLASAVSGVRLTGEQRACAVADFNQDGRVDLAVTQHRGATALFRNQLAVPGLRVRLRGPAFNPDAIGAVIRPRYRDGQLGPARIVQVGSGHWSQDSATLIMGDVERTTALWVRWPGGRISETTVTRGATAVTVDHD